MKQPIKLLKFALLIMLALMLKQANAQYEWAPIGAEWYYNHPNYSSLDGNGSKYLLFNVNKDTLIEGKICKEISILENSNVFIANEYLHQTGDSIYYYNYYSKTFHLLYDFSAKAGDTVIVHNNYFNPTKGFFADAYNDSIPQFKYLIQNVDSVKISNKWIKRQIVTSFNKNDWGFYHESSTSDSYYILETIGSLTFFWGKSSNIHPEMQPALLRCYKDNSINYSNEIWTNDCDFHTMILEIDKFNKISIYPNPSDGIINFENNEKIECINIFDLKGKMVYSINSSIESQNIDISHLNKGLYVAQVRLNSSTYSYRITLN